MNNFRIISIKGQFHFPIHVNNKIFLYLLCFIDKIFRNSILKYIASTVFIKVIKK